MCFPSIAPIQFGKFHLAKKSSAMVSHSTSEGTGICIDTKASDSTVHTSKIICLAVETPILKL